MPTIHAQRIRRVLQAMEARGIDQAVISDPESIWYLTGYDVIPHERFFVLSLHRSGSCRLFLNRLFPAPETDLPQVWFSDTDTPVALLANTVDPAGVIGVDKDWPARFLLPLMELLPGASFTLVSDCLDRIRACKDPAEQELMRQASRINDQVMEKAASFIREGMREQDVAAYMAGEYAAAGCERGYDEPLVCFGANAADPHHQSDGTRLRAGDCIVIDTGCRKDRYCSDMTRTFFCKTASPKHLAIHDLVRSANELAESLVRSGVPLRELDRAARERIAAAGYGEFFTHRLGHFIGQRVHEQGDVSASSPLIAQPGMIFSIEPGVYLPGEFGVRVEDLVLVTEDGCEVLNRVDKRARFVG